MQTIGFIGLGHMGNPMVKNLLKAGYKVKVYDLNSSAVQALEKEGAIAVNSIKEIAEHSDIVFTMLQTGEQVKQCTSGSQGLFSYLAKDALYIDSSSVDVAASKATHQAAREKHLTMLDAPVSGGVGAAKAATLTFMVGGEEEAFQRAKPILSAVGKKIVHVGTAGNGAAAKICNNMILGISMIAVSEAFVLADKLGLAADKLFEVCSNASGQCWSLSSYCPWPGILPNVPSSHDYTPGFTAKMMLKDLNLSQNAADFAKSITPLGKQATEIYEQFVEEGHAEQDFSAIINYIKALKNK
jgi:3-hydroxyisobutyrate dehydrogenase